MTEHKKTISNDNEITGYVHCGLCLKELPDDQSPAEWCRLNVGWTKQGLQVWCVRHNVNVCHIDFQGQQHPANTSRKLRSKEMS
jgi:hypothetical protein